ncbi:MAG: alkaline phosphatase [Cyanobacteria bacterium P01_A01_bin.45]
MRFYWQQLLEQQQPTFSGVQFAPQGREEDIDNNEAVLIDLESPLNLDSTLGGSAVIDANDTMVPKIDAPKNVIIIVGDGMGWEMVRAAAIAQQIDEGHQGNTLEDFYTEGKGEGLSFQELEGYTNATTYSTIIDGDKGNSALKGDPRDRVTGEGELREGFTLPGDSDSTGFNPIFNPYADEDSPGEGNLVGYDPQQGGTQPWLDGSNPDYIKQNYTDSAAAGTSLYSGVKTFAGALGVDIFEQPVETILETAKAQGKATGTVSSVPFSHATPAAPASHVNNRGKLDDGVPEGALEGGEFDVGDSVTQQMLLETQPDLILGGGHPLDYNNTDSEIGGELSFRFIAESTYEELSNNPDGDNLYGYNFLERNPNAGEALLEAATALNPEDGDRLFGLYGARGQNGNLPLVTADSDYSNTGLNTFSHRSSQMAGETPDINRPLLPGETVEDFIAREADENPTLAEMTVASLEFLSKDEDGFFLSVEQGDMDWVLHDNNMDNLLGTFRDIDETVEVTIDWIEENGGWEENLLIVTADHDHYMTLTEEFPALYREYGGEALTTAFDSSTAGHYFGSDSEDKYQWGSHSNRPVPVYYQGAGSDVLDGFIGEGFENYGVEVAGIPDHIDLVHIAQTARTAILNMEEPAEDKGDLINLLGKEDLSIEVSAEVNAGFDNIGGFYKAIDAKGTVIDPINGMEIAVGDAGYEAAALANSMVEIGDGDTTTVDLAGGFAYIPYILSNGDAFYTEFAEANPDGIDHVATLEDKKFGFEDLFGGGDRDFNDLVLTVETI